MSLRIEPPGTDASQMHWSHREQLPMWTIYRHPADYPQGYVGRMFLTLGHDEPVATAVAVYGDTLEDVREAMPYGAFALTRHPSDHPTVVETWL